MKIITDSCAYVQRVDIDNLIREDIVISESVFLKFIENDNGDMYGFIKFNDLESIEYLKKMDCIVDYKDIKDLSSEQIIELGKSLAEKSNDIRNKINSMPQSQTENMIMHCKLLNFKVRSLCNVYQLKNNSIKIKLPKEIRKSDNTSSPKTVVRKLTKSLFRRKTTSVKLNQK